MGIGGEMKTVPCPRHLSISVHLVRRKNKHLYVSLGLTGGLLEYKSAIVSVFSVSYLINVTCGLQMAEDEGIFPPVLHFLLFF